MTYKKVAHSRVFSNLTCWSKKINKNNQVRKKTPKTTNTVTFFFLPFFFTFFYQNLCLTDTMEIVEWL